MIKNGVVEIRNLSFNFYSVLICIIWVMFNLWLGYVLLFV